MINSDEANLSDPETIETIVAEGPKGALAVAAIATFIVILTWILFYLLVFLPRGT